ncbi:uncharacterized protein LOC124171749 [Ischnura elegans]|uniref:uncharacterized protein LOC124171749 n=1 Tax=Ischnura elegans TaxID=197161 RepID=UPI001ED8B1AB|nr:uncharacterized protein LOC124171749 [Ischnura elegans]
MDSLCGISRSLYGQPWTSWCTSKELESEEEAPEREKSQPAADVMRLPKEDMTLFGFCPEQDDFYIVICELCGLGIKPMGMNHHMNLRHSKGEESSKTTPIIKNNIKECDVKPKNKKHVSTASIVADFGHGVGPPQKVFTPESTSVSVVKAEHHQEPPQIRPPSNSKLLKVEAEKINKHSSSSKNHSKQYNSQDVIAKLSNTVNAKLPSVKSSRSSSSHYVDSVKQSKSGHRTVPIKSGLRLQLVGTTNLLLFKRNSRAVLAAASELKVRHRRRHRRSRSHRSRSKIKTSKRILPIVVKSSHYSPIIAPSPSLAPSPYVALTPLKTLKWNNNVEGIPSHLKPSFSSHPSGFHAGSLVPVSKASDGVLQMLTVDTAHNHMVKSELRPPILSCKPHGLMRNHLDSRMSHSYLPGNSMLVPALMPQAPIRVPDISWSSGHPKSLGVCPLQIRKVGGMITSDRRLDCFWQYMKSALLEQEAYQTTVLCSSPSSQPDFHQNHKSSIKTILANLSSNNYSRNSVCKPSNMGLRQFPLNAYSEKSYSASLRGVIDVPPSVLLISSNNSKALSKNNSFISQVTKVSPIIKHNPPCTTTTTTTQPYPGIFLKNGQHVFPRHFRISLKRRKPMPVVNNVVKKQKESDAGEKLENMVYHEEYNLPKCVPLMQFPASNGLSEPVNNFTSYPEEGFKQVATQSELEVDVNSIGLITTNGESLIEPTGRLPSLDQIKNDLISSFHTMKSTSQIMDTTNKSTLRKVTTTQCPNVRISSATGTVQVSKPQITYLATGPVTFQQISPQMISQIQLQPKSKHPSAAPLKLIGPPQTVSLAAPRTMLLQQEKDES